MPEILPSDVPSPRTLLAWDGTRFRALSIDAAGQLQIDVVTSGLPAGAATAANQAIEITALQLIDNLYNALQSVNTDALQVRGEDQLFSYKDQLLETFSVANAAAGNNTLQTAVVPAGEVWVLTSCAAINETSVTTRTVLDVYDGAVAVRQESREAPAAQLLVSWQGHSYLVAGDRARAVFVGCVLNDTIRFYVHGYKMSKE